MENKVSFERNNIAACGINCATCIGFLRVKNKCGGCRNNVNKPNYCVKCIITNCEFLAATKSKFCFECKKFPCKRMKELDKRYRTKYNLSLIENLRTIENIGIDKFLENENIKWECKKCGSVLCVHRNECILCKTIN